MACLSGLAQSICSPRRSLNGKQLRWGLIGVGDITNDFCFGLLANGSVISAVGARDSDRAEAFAKRVGAKRAYGSYEEVAQDPDVDIVYVGTIHPMHLSHAKLALEAGKHVLCEKPMCVNSRQLQELVTVARKRRLFLMEAMWTRFFPAIRKAREVLSSGELGAPKAVQGDFGFICPESKVRYWDPATAGGVMLDLGVYLVQAATMVFGPSFPDQLACTGMLTEAGLDAEGCMSMNWNGKGSASFLMTLKANTPEELIVVCEKGSVRFRGSAHCPTHLVVTKTHGRGDFTEQVLDFPLPKCSVGVKVNFPHSEGMLYQVQAVEKCVQEGLLECPEYSLDESIVVMQIMDSYRKQVGVKYPFE